MQHLFAASPGRVKENDVEYITDRRLHHEGTENTKSTKTTAENAE